MADLTVSMTYMKRLFDHENFPKVFFLFYARVVNDKL